MIYFRSKTQPWGLKSIYTPKPRKRGCSSISKFLHKTLQFTSYTARQFIGSPAG